MHLLLRLMLWDVCEAKLQLLSFIMPAIPSLASYLFLFLNRRQTKNSLSSLSFLSSEQRWPWLQCQVENLWLLRSIWTQKARLHVGYMWIGAAVEVAAPLCSVCSLLRVLLRLMLRSLRYTLRQSWNISSAPPTVCLPWHSSPYSSCFGS